MSLALTYTEYKNINSEYIKYIEELIKENNFTYNDEVRNKLLFFYERFELVRLKSDNLKEDGNEDDIQDLRYLIVDGLLLALDLVNFYSRGEVERFKMRGTNYIKKRERADMLNKF